MRRRRFRLVLSVFLLLILLAAGTASSQVAKKNSVPNRAVDPEHAASLAESGHCTEAMPLLRKTIRQSADKDLKKRIGLDGVRCAMTHYTPYDALEFLEILDREFPGDPQVLYASNHAYSDLSLHTSQELAREAPFSYQVHELNAEALELQGKWDEATAEYRKILEISPFLIGIHARIGRALLSKPQPSKVEVAEAKKAFEDE